MNPHQTSTNPSSVKSRFTEGFLRALKKINRQRSASRCPREVFRGYYKVKTAAEKSLACAVGSRRAWSRAVLCKIRNQARRRRALVRRIENQAMKKNCLKEKISGGEEGGFGQAKELRKLVPGGEAMDLCNLLDEAAHYIKCLNTQVQVMRRIADFYSI